MRRAIVLMLLVGCNAEETPEARGERVRAENDAREQAGKMHRLVEQYMLIKRACPASPADLVDAGVAQRVDADPWGQEYAIRCSDAGSIEVRSLGRDGTPDTADDLIGR